MVSYPIVAQGSVLAQQLWRPDGSKWLHRRVVKTTVSFAGRPEPALAGQRVEPIQDL